MKPLCFCKIYSKKTKNKTKTRWRSLFIFKNFLVPIVVNAIPDIHKYFTEIKITLVTCQTTDTLDRSKVLRRKRQIVPPITIFIVEEWFSASQAELNN